MYGDFALIFEQLKKILKDSILIRRSVQHTCTCTQWRRGRREWNVKKLESERERGLKNYFFYFFLDQSGENSNRDKRPKISNNNNNIINQF